MMVRLKRNRERIMSICLIRFLIGYFRRILHIPEHGGFYKNEGILLGGFLDYLGKKLELLFGRSKLGVCFRCLHNNTSDPESIKYSIISIN